MGNLIQSKKKNTDTITLISFIIPVYNNETYLAQSVESVLRQIKCRKDIEIVIVDDGSTDNTPGIADEIGSKDGRVRVIHQKNQWIYASFNNGIKEAKGEYIYILNSDDLLYDGAVQLLIDGIEKYNHPDVIWTKVIWQDVDVNQNVLNERDMNKDVLADEYIDSAVGVRQRWLFLQTSELAINQANLYKRNLALAHPFDNSYYAGDVLFNIGIADEIQSMVILSSPIYKYLNYDLEGFNASVGKYYGYEHKMFSRIFEEEMRLYRKWGYEEEYSDYSVLKRLRALTYEISILDLPACGLSFVEKIKKIFGEIADPLIREAARMVKREREYESRILNGAKTLAEKNDMISAIPTEIRPLIYNLPSDYRDNIDLERIDKSAIKSAITSKENKDGIGRVYYSENW